MNGILFPPSSSTIWCLSGAQRLFSRSTSRRLTTYLDISGISTVQTIRPLSEPSKFRNPQYTSTCSQPTDKKLIRRQNVQLTLDLMNKLQSSQHAYWVLVPAVLLLSLEANIQTCRNTATGLPCKKSALTFFCSLQILKTNSDYTNLI